MRCTKHIPISYESEAMQSCSSSEPLTATAAGSGQFVISKIRISAIIGNFSIIFI